ncbi:MAG: hypothetical protein NVS4B9_31790 [Ktedonobacteraceae bacterium]
MKKKLENILGMVLLVCIIAFIVSRIFFNMVENIRLVTGGTVTQGIIYEKGYCPKRGRAFDMGVQFTDTHGKQQYAKVEDACGYIGLPFRHDGDHVSVVYLPNTPTVARIQSDLILQFWLLEFPFLLFVFFILLFLLFILFSWLLLRHSKSS